MDKRIILALILIGFLAAAGAVAAAKPTVFLTTQVNPSGRSVVIPDTAVQVAPNVFSLGSAVDPQTGLTVEGLAFIHKKDEFTHRPGHVNSAAGSTNTTCYSYLAKGAKWKTIEDWIMNPANTRSLNQTTVFSLEAGALSKWEDGADGIVGNGFGPNIFGNGTPTTGLLSADTVSPDGTNEIYFADVSSQGAIAVTIVWGYFSGPTFARQLIEWDQVYDDVDFDWSATTSGVAGKMDFENIAVHENGHGAGMGHPSDSCAEETMYRFAGSGETKKRDLNSGDIAGIDKLY